MTKPFVLYLPSFPFQALMHSSQTIMWPGLTCFFHSTLIERRDDGSNWLPRILRVGNSKSMSIFVHFNPNEYTIKLTRIYIATIKHHSKGGGGGGKFLKLMLHSPSNGNRILLQKVCKTAFATVAFTMQQLSLSRKTWSEGCRLKGNMCERMVCVGGEATVLLDLVLLRMICCCTYFRGMSWIGEKGQTCLRRLHPKLIVCHLTKEPW